MAATHTTNCKKCGRVLRTARSIAAGYGPTCARKIRIATERVTAAATFKSYQLDRATELIELGGVLQIRFGEYAAVSSKGDATYAANALIRTCTCPAGERGVACYHLAAALILIAA